jgi:hypothetical protein
MAEDPRPGLVALVVRMAATPRAERPPLLLQLLPLLGDARLPEPARIGAAARALKLVPDRERPVRRIARALTTGLSPSRALDRLRQLQHQIEKSAALDKLIERREKRVKLACPRCRIRLARVEMIKHLWHEHGLMLAQGKTRTTARRIEELEEQHRNTGEGEALERVVELSGAAGLRKWLAGDAPIEEVKPLVLAAGEAGAGLCPGCFAQLPAPVSPLPSPLVLLDGRLAGDGYAIQVGGNAWFHTLRVTTPATATSVGRRSFSPRAMATFAAAAVLAIALLVARSFPVAAAGVLLGFGVYLMVRGWRAPADRPEDRAVDAAWERFASKLADRPQTARFLTRLCLASAGFGDPESRAGLLNAIARRAADKVEESDAELQLLAAARMLQVEDQSYFGRDVAAGVAALAAEGFSGALPADYAEFVVGCYLARPRDPGELARLRMLLLGAAFDARLVPRDLLDIWAGAPNLAHAMAVEPSHRLGFLHGVWRARADRPWEAVALAETVFDLARIAPPTAMRVLSRFPDLLLFHRPEPIVEAMLGPILICARGVSVGGHLLADPDARIELDDNGHELNFGRHRIEVARPLPLDLPARLTKWLRFRAEVLVPFIDGYLAPGSSGVARRVLGPFCRRCLTCGTVSAIASGAIGRVVKA